ncbi:hypothetical protein [Dyadobacter sp. 3J3]|uniref:hypothetical protein n=1 Tax=Dyadobacter sp. 3J3 TaxID=2606600 RepID=UPI0013574814|nr:hypothetical protein [Dyadobacter sp. 3J3]
MEIEDQASIDDNEIDKIIQLSHATGNTKPASALPPLTETEKEMDRVIKFSIGN